MKNSIIIAVLVTVVVGGGAFFGGMKYQQNKQPAFPRQFNGQQVQRMGNGGNQNSFQPVNGEIISADDKSITVKLQDGSTKLVFFSDKTEINKATGATKEDLKTGEIVVVFGQKNSDGSITAQNIQLNPIARNFPNQNQAE